jgi:hypothetical protein
MTTDAFTIHWPYLLLAIALLWFPRGWLRTGKRLLKKRHKPDDALERLAGVGAKDPENKSVQLGREFGNFRNYVDLFRALAGSYSLGYYAFTGGEGTRWGLLGGQTAVLLVATLIQSVRYDKRLSFYAPIFFFVGMSTGFIGDYTPLFAFALTLAINPAIPNPRWFLSAWGVFMLPLGVVFGANLPALSGAAGCILLPPLVSLLLKRPLVIFTRKGRASSRAR